MEINALRKIAEIVEDRWYDVYDLALIVGFNLKIAGINYKTNDELIKMLILMTQIGFLDVKSDDASQIKVRSNWIVEAQSV
jgi:hypothetical protein